MSIVNNTELQQRITDLRQRLDKIPKFHIREDYTSLIDFLSETQSFLYSTLSAINVIANNIDDIISVSSNITELLQVDTNATLAEESAAAAVLSANSAASATTLCQEYMNTAEEAKEDAEQALSNVITIFNEQLIEYASSSAFPTIGEENVIYIALDTGTKYKWSGTIYNELSGGISLGETSSTAYRGDRGKTAYDHSQLLSASDPHGFNTLLDTKVDKITGKGLSTEDYTTEEKNKLNVIEAGANKYVHPSTHEASIITQDSIHRFVTDTEKTKLSNATSTPTASRIVISSVTGKLDNWISDASTSSAGKVQLATDAETITGTDTVRAITSAGLTAALNAKVGVANSDLIKTALNVSGDAPIYPCRAWVSFNGSGTVTILGAGNISSITDRGTGLYTANILVAMPDTYVATIAGCKGDSGEADRCPTSHVVSISQVYICTANSGASKQDVGYVTLAIIK